MDNTCVNSIITVDDLPTYKEVYPENDDLPKYFDLFPKKENENENNNDNNDAIECENLSIFEYKKKIHFIRKIAKQIKTKEQTFDQVTYSILQTIIKKSKKLNKTKRKIFLYEVINFFGKTTIYISFMGIFAVVCITVVNPGTIFIPAFLSSCGLLISTSICGDFLYFNNKMHIKNLKEKCKKYKTKIKTLVSLIDIEDINKN